MDTDKNVSAKDVVDVFKNGFELLDQFRHQNGLDKTIKNPHECFTGMTDKNSRFGRQIKHFFRNNPKSDWPDGAGKAIMGYLVYTHLMIECIVKEVTNGTTIKRGFYNGFEKELNSMVKQHAPKQKACVKYKASQALSNGSQDIVFATKDELLEAIQIWLDEFDQDPKEKFNVETISMSDEEFENLPEI